MDVTWDTVPPFPCVLQLSRHLRFLFARSLPEMAGEFLYPLYMYHFIYPLKLFISK
jgi:hypothetical protein